MACRLFAVPLLLVSLTALPAMAGTPFSGKTSGTLTIAGSQAGFNDAVVTGSAPATIVLRHGVTSQALVQHAQLHDAFDADLTVGNQVEHLHNVRVTKYSEGGLKSTSDQIMFEEVDLSVDSIAAKTAPGPRSRLASTPTSTSLPSVFTKDPDPGDDADCRDGELPRLKTYALNDCDAPQADTYVFADGTPAQQEVSGTKARFAYAIDDETTATNEQAILDNYSALLKSQGWTIVHADNLSVTARSTGDGPASWAEVSVNGPANYQIVYLTQ